MMTNDSAMYFEILRMAKQIIMQEYIDRRAQEHNKWLVESDHLWRTQRLRLAYPAIPNPPTEKDVVERAQTMLDFINKKDTTALGPAAQPTPAPVATSTTEEEVKEEEIPAPEPPLDIPPIDETPPPVAPPQGPKPLEQQQPATTQEEPKSLEEQLIEAAVRSSTFNANSIQNSSMASRVLPTVLKKIEEIRNEWRN